METINKIPRWNLDSIFSSLDSAEYKTALSNYQTAIKNVGDVLNEADAFSSEKDFLPWLAKFLENQNKLLIWLEH